MPSLRSLGVFPLKPCRLAGSNRPLARRVPAEKLSTETAMNTSAPSPAAVWPGLALAGVGAVAFSGKAIIIKLAYRHGVDPVTLIMYRMLFALPLFLLLAWWAGRGREPLSRRDLMLVSGLGFIGYYLSSFMDFVGLQYVSAGLERLILYLNPTLVLLGGWALYGRRATLRQGLALAVSYLGVLLVFGQEMHFAGPHVALGAVLVLGSATTYALYLIFSGQEVRRIGSARLTGWATAIACLLCIAQFLILKPLSAAAVPAPVLWLSLLNGLLCTFAPVLMVMMAIERIGPALTSQTGMIGPLSTITMGVLILDEQFTPVVVLGTLCVLAGIWLLARAR